VWNLHTETNCNRGDPAACIEPHRGTSSRNSIVFLLILLGRRSFTLVWMRKAVTMLVVLSAGCSMEAMSEDTASSEQAVKKKTSTVTKITVNGRSASTFLIDDAGTNGFLTVTEDQVAGTIGLDFSYATPDAANPDLAILFQGAGEIPSGSFAQTASSAHLNLTTPVDYAINRCVININTAEYTCAATTPLAFDVTWAQNGLGSVHEQTRRRETLGPVTTKVNAEFTTVTATVTGTWGGRSAPELTGELTDSESKTYIREITVAN